MQGESSTAPVSPPPGPLMPGRGLLGPGISPQHELVSLVEASSKMIIRRPFWFLYAGEEVILGTHSFRNCSIPAYPPGRFGLAQVASWPSEHRSGVMNTRLGVLEARARSWASGSRFTTWLWQ